MSWETARENRSQIQEFVESLLLDDDRHKLWRKLAISERGVGKGLIGEILGTPHGPVFVSRISMDDEKGYRDEEPDSRQSRMRGIEPVTGDPDQGFYMASRRAQFVVDAGYLLAHIQAGKRNVVLRPDYIVETAAAERPRSRSLTGGHELRSIAPNTSNGTS
jgi:hypothetical protein